MPSHKTLLDIEIDPVPKPRMVKSDSWKKRPAVERYWAFKDELLLKIGKGFEMPESDYHLIFWIQMPKSWSEKKKEEMLGRPHQQRPDKDNLEKAFLDCVCKEDCTIWDGRVSKYWGITGKIFLKKTGRKN